MKSSTIFYPGLFTNIYRTRMLQIFTDKDKNPCKSVASAPAPFFLRGHQCSIEASNELFRLDTQTIVTAGKMNGKSQRFRTSNYGIGDIDCTLHCITHC
jgi:hypothetical protein